MAPFDTSRGDFDLLHEFSLIGVHRIQAEDHGMLVHVCGGVAQRAERVHHAERFLAAHVRGKGIVVFTACSHAGVINVLKHAQSSLPAVPLHTVAGGFHLAGGNEKIIGECVRDIGTFGLTMMAPGHCTGWRAINALANAYGDSTVAPLAVGKIFTV